MPAQRINFTAVTNHPFYVDKTKLISDFHSNMMAFIKVRLILTKRGSFASTNLAMIQEFYGSPASRPMFRKMNVGKNYRAMNDQGKYPIVMLNFSDFNKMKQNDVLLYLQKKLVELYREFESIIMSSDQVSALYKRDYKAFLTSSHQKDDLGDVFQMLLTCLEKATGQRVVVLIDSIDRPFEHAPSQATQKNMIAFYERWVKGNDEIIEMVVMTANSDTLIPTMALSSKLGNVVCQSTLHEGSYLLPHFGFTSKDLDILFERHKSSLSPSPSLMNSITKRAGGYFTSEGKQIYDPVQVMKMLQRRLKKQSVLIEGDYSSKLDLDAIIKFVSGAFKSGAFSLAKFHYILHNQTVHFKLGDEYMSLDFSQPIEGQETVLVYLINQGLLAIKHNYDPTKRHISSRYNEPKEIIIPNYSIYKFIKEEIFENCCFNPKGNNFVPCPPFAAIESVKPSLQTPVTLFQPERAPAPNPETPEPTLLLNPKRKKIDG